MAIVDRPMMAPGPSAIQPYLQGQGRRRIEDEIATMLLGINPTDRANMGGALPGGTGGGGGGFAGTAPGGGGGGSSFAASAAPGGLQVGSVPMGSGGFSGSDAGGPDGGYGVASPDQSLAGVVDAIGNLASFATNPIGAALQFGYQATQNPTARSTSVFGNLSDLLGIGTQGGPVGDFGGVTAVDGYSDRVGDTVGLGFSGSGPDGFGGPDPAGVAESAAAASTDGTGMPYMDGGYTGDGPMTQPAGTVHKGEYVIPADVVAMLGVPFFEALKKVGGG
jgi:hypothetical protein